MEYSRSVVWLGLVLISCNKGWGLLNSDSQDLGYNLPPPSNEESSPIRSPHYLDGIVRSLLSDVYYEPQKTEDRRTSYPTRGNIRKSFDLLTTTTARTTPHFEALTNDKNETGRSRKKTYFINNEKVEVENSQELVEKFKELKRGQKRNYGSKTTVWPSYRTGTYEESLEERTSQRTPLDSSGPNANLHPLPIRHWSTEPNIIREDEFRGSSYPYAFSTPYPPSSQPYGSRGNIRYTAPTTERPERPSYEQDYEAARAGKNIPTQLFRVNNNRNAYIAPTTYRPPFNGNGRESYSFSFRTQNHSRQESGDTRGNFRGSIKFMDTFGRNKQIDYEGNPEKGLVTSESPFVSVAGRTGQRYIPPITSPRPFTPNGLSYSYSFRTDDPTVSSTASYDDYRAAKTAGYQPTLNPLYNPTYGTRLPPPDGSYLFMYNAGDHQRHEVRDRNGNVKGVYSYQAPDGETKMVQYTADAQNGFVAQGSHIPVQQGRILTGGYPDERPEDGSYYFSYDAGDHARQEVRDNAGNVHGSFSFITADGGSRSVNYQASPQDGFIASGQHIPTQSNGAYLINQMIGAK